VVLLNRITIPTEGQNSTEMWGVRQMRGWPEVVERNKKRKGGLQGVGECSLKERQWGGSRLHPDTVISKPTAYVRSCYKGGKMREKETEMNTKGVTKDERERE